MKKFEVKRNGSALTPSLSVLFFCAQLCAASLLRGSVGTTVSADKLTVLTVAFNVLSCGLAPVLGLASDTVSNKSIGVRLGVLILGTGFVWPAEWGVTLKVVLAAAGLSVITVFASSAILSAKKHIFGIGAFIGAGAVGMALGRYMPILGYITVAVMLLCAAFMPNEEFCSFDIDKRPFSLKKLSGLLFAAVVTVLAVLISAQGSFMMSDLFITRKKFVIYAVIFLIGAFAGGFLNKNRVRTVSLAVLSACFCLVGILFPERGFTVPAVILLSGSLVPLFYGNISEELPDFRGFSAGTATAAVYGGYLISNVSSAEGAPKKPLIVLVGIMAAALILLLICELAILILRRREKK